MPSGLKHFQSTPITEGYTLPRWRRWTRSLRFRLTAWYSGVLALVLVTGYIVLYFGAQRELLNQTDLFLSVEAQRIAESAAGPHGVDVAGVTQAVLSPAPIPLADALQHQPQPALGRLLFEVLYIRVSMRDGHRVLATSPDLLRQADLLTCFDTLLAGAGKRDEAFFTFVGPDEERQMRVLTRTVGSALWVQVGVPFDHYKDLLDHISLVLALGLLATLVLVAVGGWVLVGRTLQPIGRIVSQAESLDADNVFDVLLPAEETDSEIGQLVRTLNHMMSRLRRAFDSQQRFADAQQRFAADASHELRTPLTILRGEMEVALNRPRSVESYQTTIRSAVEEIDRMSHIVQALSFLARQDALQMTAEPVREAVDMSLLVRTVKGEFDKSAADKRIALSCKNDLETAWILGDEGQLHQLLRNLVENAIKFTPEGGKVTITLVRRSGPPGYAIQVEDTGVGLAEDNIPHVFERFWRAERSRTTPGSGLGLAISARIADLHGGTLKAYSRGIGRGTRFDLFVPEPPVPSAASVPDRD